MALIELPSTKADMTETLFVVSSRFMDNKYGVFTRICQYRNFDIFILTCGWLVDIMQSWLWRSASKMPPWTSSKATAVLGRGTLQPSLKHFGNECSLFGLLPMSAFFTNGSRFISRN